MQATKTIFVTGATGNQGGAVARNLLERGYQVKALTRNPASTQAVTLAKLGAEVIKGDLNQVSTYHKQLAGVDGVFSVQTFVNGVEKEIAQGISLANLAKEHHIRHFVYASVAGAAAATGIPHWESKHIIEQHIRQTGIPFTIIRPVAFYQNFLIPQIKARILKGKLVFPVKGDKLQQYISTEDIGKICVQLFTNPDHYMGKTIPLAGEQMNMHQAAALFSEVLGKNIQYQKLPGLITRLVMGRNLYKMFNWINTHDAVFVKDLDSFKQEFSGLTPLKDWIHQQFVASNRRENSPVISSKS